MSTEVVIALIGVFGALLTGILSFHSGLQVRKQSALATSTQTLISLQTRLQEMHDQIILIKNELDDVKDRNALLWAWVVDLLKQLETHNIEPVRPPDRLYHDEKVKSFLELFYKRTDDDPNSTKGGNND